MVEAKREAIVWDVVEQKELTPKIAVSEKKSLLSPTGRWLAFADRVGVLKLWDVDEEREILLPDQRPPTADRILFDADERWLLAVNGMSVQLWGRPSDTNGWLPCEYFVEQRRHPNCRDSTVVPRVQTVVERTIAEFGARLECVHWPTHLTAISTLRPGPRNRRCAISSAT
ncbi:MAG: hypothetical protein IH991_21415 [Planctomycetes bacterium]|nr:hypothetical protein [Planctomycetota bacterium]